MADNIRIAQILTQKLVVHKMVFPKTHCTRNDEREIAKYAEQIISLSFLEDEVMRTFVNDNIERMI